MSDVFFMRLGRSDADPGLGGAGVTESGHKLLLGFLLLALGILVVGAALLDVDRWPSLAASAFLLGAASLVAGGLIGLLFGVPRVIGVVTDEETQPASRRAGHRTGYVANTNLERVSDWLSAIIVGVTLTQLGELPGLFQRLVDYVTNPFGSTVTPTMVAGTVVLFAIGGFIFGYLWSRLTLGPAFLAADRRSVEEIVEAKVEEKLEAAVAESSSKAEAAVRGRLERLDASVQGLQGFEGKLEERLARVEGKVDDGLVRLEGKLDDVLGKLPPKAPVVGRVDQPPPQEGVTPAEGQPPDEAQASGESPVSDREPPAEGRDLGS